MKKCRVICLFLVGCVFSFVVLPVAFGDDPNSEGMSTSPYVISAELYQRQEATDEGDGPLITFSEFPIDTHITDQYADLGIIFDGDYPLIRPDYSNPTSPVLAGD
jgi:hypothetical protein